MATGHSSPSERIGYDCGLNQTTSVEDPSRQFHRERGAGSGSHGNPEEVSASTNARKKKHILGYSILPVRILTDLFTNAGIKVSLPSF
jgi:hypothetical protein